MGVGSGAQRVNLALENSVQRNMLLFGCEDSCRFNDVIGTNLAPFDGARFLLVEDVNGFAFDEKFSILRLDVAFEATMD